MHSATQIRYEKIVTEKKYSAKKNRYEKVVTGQMHGATQRYEKIVTRKIHKQVDEGGFAKLFVGSVPRTATEEDIRPLFEEEGRVLEVAFIKDKRTGQQQALEMPDILIIA
ncbi:hypothetical protein FXO38_00573 [Capsicum annuum]|nr:hypothetical protein FXO37_06066 [Capsicum annuum]KAF3683827.1 hypothetical protein FXO38_00573 [Capsicum annuum]